MATWYSFAAYTPTTKGPYRVAVHPNGCNYYSFWAGSSWTTPCSDLAAASLQRRYTFNVTTDFWFQPLENSMIGFRPTHAYTKSGPNRRAKNKTAMPVPHPLAKYVTVLPVAFKRDMMAEWYKLEEYVPESRGDYQVMTSDGVQAASRWTGTKFNMRNVAFWKGLS